MNKIILCGNLTKDMDVKIIKGKTKKSNDTIVGRFTLAVNEGYGDNKTSREINELLIEEISELIQAVIKLQRWDNGETTLRYNIDEIYDNLYEELGDVIIMMLQFIHKNNIEYEKLLNKMCKKLIRYYETKQE